MDRALLDISPDDAVDLNNKKRILRWDAKKRKFVKQTLQEMAESQQRGVKRMRSETGIISKKSALPQVRSMFSSVYCTVLCHVYSRIYVATPT